MMFNQARLLAFSQAWKRNRSLLLLGTVTTVTTIGFVANYYNTLDPVAHKIVIEQPLSSNDKNKDKKIKAIATPKKAKDHRDLAEEILAYGIARCDGGSISHVSSSYEHDHYYPFDTQEFPEIYTPAIPVRPQAPSVFTIAVAPVNTSTFLFRQQTLFKIAVALPSSSLDRAKLWSREHNKTMMSKGNVYYGRQEEQGDRTLSNYLLQKVNIVTPYEIANPLKVAITCRFLQSTPTQDFIDLFRNAFDGTPWRYFAYLDDALSKAISDEKLRPGEELAFYWFDDGEMLVTKNGDIRGRIYKEGVNRRFLEAFVDEDRTVCSELVKSLNEHIPIM